MLNDRMNVHATQCESALHACHSWHQTSVVSCNPVKRGYSPREAALDCTVRASTYFSTSINPRNTIYVEILHPIHLKALHDHTIAMDRVSHPASRGKSLSEATTRTDCPQASGEVGDVNAQLRNFAEQHRWDPFLDVQKLENVDAAISSGDTAKQVAVDESLIQENSPYPEVRSSVPPTDTPVPVDTARAWCIGVITCTIVAACNVLLGLPRSPITISATVVQLISYPMGCAWARFVPHKTFRLVGREIAFNPGHFNVKEHTIITMITAAGSMPSYAIDILLAQEIFYQQYFKWGFQILLTISTQAMGFGLAGISRRFLVWPSAMVWPGTLVTTTVMYSLHDHSRSDPTTTNGWRIGRYKFFLVMASITFLWEWVPQVFAIFLQLFMFPVWIAPNNVVVNQIFGGQTGLGILPISFDWSVISGFLLSPLQTSAFAIFNIGAGILFMFIGGTSPCKADDANKHEENTCANIEDGKSRRL